MVLTIYEMGLNSTYNKYGFSLFLSSTVLNPQCTMFCLFHAQIVMVHQQINVENMHSRIIVKKDPINSTINSFYIMQRMLLLGLIQLLRKFHFKISLNSALF